jgi:hypothetical protein
MIKLGNRRDRGRRDDEGHQGPRCVHPNCFSEVDPSTVTCGPATYPRAAEHLCNLWRQAQVRDEECIIDTDKLCPTGRGYQKDLTAASSPRSGKLCPGFTASQALAGPVGRPTVHAVGFAKKSPHRPLPRVGGCKGGSGDSGTPGGIARFADAAGCAPDGRTPNGRLTAGGESRRERVKMLTTSRTVTPILVPQTSCDPRPQVRHPLRTT